MKTTFILHVYTDEGMGFDTPKTIELAIKEAISDYTADSGMTVDMICMGAEQSEEQIKVRAYEDWLNSGEE